MQRARTLSFENFSVQDRTFTFEFVLDDEPVAITLTHSLPITLETNAKKNRPL